MLVYDVLELSEKRRSEKKFKSCESENELKSHSYESSAKKAEKRQYMKPHSESFDVLDSAKSEKRDNSAGCFEPPSSKKKKMKLKSTSSLEAETLTGKKPGESGLCSQNLSSFAQNVKEKMLRKKSTSPTKPKSKKTKKAKDFLQRSFISFDEMDTKELSNGPQKFDGLNRPQKTNDIVDRMLSLSGTSLEKEGREEHNSDEGLCPNMKISLVLGNLNESNSKNSDSKKSSRSRPSRCVSIGDTFLGDEMMHHSTPHGRNFNGNWKDEKLSPIEMLKLQEDEMEREYYGRKQMRNARRKERRKATKAKWKALGIKNY